MSKSAIYTVNSSSQDVAVNGTINLGNINRRFGNYLTLQGNAIQLAGPGYYDVNASITLEGTAAGDVTVTLYKDGIALPGATASASIAAQGDFVNLSLSAIVRKFCPCADGIENLSFILSDTAATITNIAVIVEKI